MPSTFSKTETYRIDTDVVDPVKVFRRIESVSDEHFPRADFEGPAFRPVNEYTLRASFEDGLATEQTVDALVSEAIKFRGERKFDLYRVRNYSISTGVEVMCHRNVTPAMLQLEVESEDEAKFHGLLAIYKRAIEDVIAEETAAAEAEAARAKAQTSDPHSGAAVPARSGGLNAWYRDWSVATVAGLSVAVIGAVTGVVWAVVTKLV